MHAKTNTQQSNHKKMKHRILKPNSSLTGCRVLLLITTLWASAAALAAHALNGKGSFTGRTIATPLPNGKVALDFALRGPITHLGQSSVQLRSIADFSGPTPAPVAPSMGVITTSPRDTISFTVRWSVQQTSNGLFAVEGPFTITGGTGRFSNATGGGEYHGSVDLNNGTASAEMSGTLAR